MKSLAKYLSIEATKQVEQDARNPMTEDKLSWLGVNLRGTRPGVGTFKRSCTGMATRPKGGSDRLEATYNLAQEKVGGRGGWLPSWRWSNWEREGILSDLGLRTIMYLDDLVNV